MGYGLAQALRLCSNLVMTRILAPEMFGIMAVVTGVLTILDLLSDIGIRQNIIQSRRGTDPVFLDTAWTVQVIRGIVLWLTAVALSFALQVFAQAGIFPARSVYANPDLAFVIAVTSLGAVVLGFGSTKIAEAVRHLEQKRLVEIGILSQLVALSVMIALGVLYKSIWVLVVGGLTASLTTTILSHVWLPGHRNRFRYDPTSLGELVRFGKWIFVSSAAFVLAVNGDRLLLGGFLDPWLLGLYAIAALIVSACEGSFSRLFGSVALAALSEVARTNPGRLKSAYYGMRMPGDLALLFFAGFLFEAGGALINTLYDHRYSDAGSMLQILAVSFVSARFFVAQQTYVALGVPRYQAVISLVRMISLFTLVPLSYALFGIDGALWGIALHGLPTLPLFLRFNVALKIHSTKIETALLAVLPLGVASGRMVAAIWL